MKLLHVRLNSNDNEKIVYRVKVQNDRTREQVIEIEENRAIDEIQSNKPIFLYNLLVKSQKRFRFYSRRHSNCANSSEQK